MAENNPTDKINSGSQIEFNIDNGENIKNDIEDEKTNNDNGNVDNTQFNNDEDNDTNLNNDNKDENQSDYDINELYKFFKDNNIIPENEDENTQLNSIDDLSRYLYESNQKLINERVNETLNSYPETYRDLFDYVQKGGNIEQFVNSYSTSYSELNTAQLDDNINLQKKVLNDYYKATTNWNDDMIEKQLSKFSDDELGDFSKNALSDLKKYENEQKEQLMAEQSQKEQQMQEYYNNLIDNYNNKLNEFKTIAGRPITLKEKSIIKDNLFNNKTYNKISSNFDNYRLNLAILDSYGLLDDPNKIINIINNNNNSNKYNFKKNNKEQQNTNFTNNESFDFDIIQNEKSGNQDNRIDLML